MRNPDGPIRRGIPTCVSLDPDAVELLHAMVPNSKGMGLLISELLRREADRRTERLRLVQDVLRRDADRRSARLRRIQDLQACGGEADAP